MYFATQLQQFRANRIMGYYDNVRDLRLKRIVWESHVRFHGCLQKLLEERNAGRKEKKQLGMQQLEPKWLTNSVHI